MKIPNDDFPGNDLPNMRCVDLPFVKDQAKALSDKFFRETVVPELKGAKTYSHDFNKGVEPSRASKILAAGIRKEEEQIFSEIKREMEKALIAYMRRQLRRIIYDELMKDFIEKGFEMYDQPTVPLRVEIIPQDKGYLVLWEDAVDPAYCCEHQPKQERESQVTIRRVAVPDTSALLFEIASRDRAAFERLKDNEASVTVAKDACDRARILSDMMGEIIVSLDSVDNVQGSRRKELVKACNKINKELMGIWSKRLRR